jgi:HK97 family phage prohead protease
MSAPNIERRDSVGRPGTIPRLETRAGQKLICGYGAVFFNPADLGTQYQVAQRCFERIMPTCFDAALKERHDCRALINHNPDLIVGRTAAGTCRLSTDKVGLKYEVDVSDTSYCKDLVIALNRGDITGSSFSFSIIQQGWKDFGDDDDDDDFYTVREILSCTLYDVSMVTYPAYESATSGMRGSPPASSVSNSTRRRRQQLAESDL